MADESITRWLAELRDGDDSAAQRLWEVYFRQMVELARQRLLGKSAQAADEEDVALSAFKSFCLGARAGRFPRLTDRSSLWPLLVAITAHKTVDLVRYERRQKRGGAVSEQEDRVWRETPLSELISREPSPEFAAQVAEQLSRSLEALHQTGDDDLVPIALYRMEGYRNGEIADKLGCARRTIERKLRLIQSLWQKEIEP